MAADASQVLAFYPPVSRSLFLGCPHPCACPSL